MTKGFKLPVRIRYEYSTRKNSELHYAHGVWGGVNPHGEIELNFYTESDKIPPFSERIVAPDGSIGHEMAPLDGDNKVVTRDIHSRVVMNYTTAKAMHEWLEDKLASIEQEWEPNQASFFEDPEGGIEQ